MSTASTRVLVNGLAGEQFWHGCGLHQGDQSSPLFFMLVFNVLNAVFKAAEEARGLCIASCAWYKTPGIILR
jgi:hypothetical protein